MARQNKIDTPGDPVFELRKEAREHAEAAGASAIDKIAWKWIKSMSYNKALKAIRCCREAK